MQNRTNVDSSRIGEIFSNRVLLFPDETEQKSAGGIWFPDTWRSKNPSKFGTVIQVGSGRATEREVHKHPITDLNPGDRVFFRLNAGFEMDVDGREALLCWYADMFAKVYGEGDAMTIKPLSDFVAVVPDESNEKVGSLYVPNTAKNRPLRGTVLAVSEKCDVSDYLRPGDVVEYGKNVIEFGGAVPFTLGGKPVLLMKEEQLHMRLDRQPEPIPA